MEKQRKRIKFFFKILVLIFFIIIYACNWSPYDPSLIVVFTHDDYPACESLIDDLSAYDYSYREKDVTDPSSDNYEEMLTILENHGYTDSTIDYPVVYVNDTVLFDPDLVEIEEALPHDNDNSAF